ncbi:hypothetical protein [Campylobacter felis]|uniref:hypothetical protein n=1 Tax=Campylobacter felis TaxID=2974565 RepID=UPI00255E6BDA|nr:hypothetical protein [Campylobacter felis]
MSGFILERFERVANKKISYVSIGAVWVLNLADAIYDERNELYQKLKDALFVGGFYAGVKKERKLIAVLSTDKLVFFTYAAKKEAILNFHKALDALFVEED